MSSKFSVLTPSVLVEPWADNVTSNKRYTWPRMVMQLHDRQRWESTSAWPAWGKSARPHLKK
jgi:hypothetical protein